MQDRNHREARHHGINLRILTSLAMLGLLSVPAAAQIDVNETGLHDGADVYGLQIRSAPDPNVNARAVTLSAWGYPTAGTYPDVSFFAYGISSDVNLVNTGPINVQATGGAVGGDEYVLACFEAYGIHGAGWVDNTGSITVFATGGLAGSDRMADAYAMAYGLYFRDGGVINAGDITVSAEAGTAGADGNGVSFDFTETYAYAYAYGILSGSDGVDNTGNLTVTAAGGAATTDGNSIEYTGADASSRVYAIRSADDVNNTGDLGAAAWGGTSDAVNTDSMAVASSRAQAYGAFSSWGDIVNAGHIAVVAVGGEAQADGNSNDRSIARADAYGYGLSASGGDVDNTGDISVTIVGGAASVAGNDEYALAVASTRAYGIAAEGSVENAGTVTAVGGAGVAESESIADASALTYGISAVGDVINSGRITALALGGTVDSNDEANASATAYGIYSEGRVTNTGAILVAAVGRTDANDGVSAPAEAYGIYAEGDVINSGEISVIATHGVDANTAYGIYMNADGNLTNTGSILTNTDTAYELYVASGTTTLVDTYRLTVGGDDPCRAYIFVADGATLALNDATLVVTSIEEQPAWNTPYRIFAIDSNGVVAGGFGSVQNLNPDVRPVYDTHGTANAVDDTVALSYGPDGSESLESVGVEKQVVSQAVSVVNHQMTSLLLQNVLSLGSSPLLADAGPTEESMVLGQSASDKTAGVFVEPYYSRIEKDANPIGYDADMWGFSAGYEQFVNDSLLGLHFGYGKADIDYTGDGYRANSEDQDVLTAGVNGLTRWDPWLLRYGLTGFYGFHDYQGLTGLSLDERETASYHSYGASMALTGGRIFRMGPHVLLPEAGLEWLWAHREQYATQAEDPDWDTAHSSTNDHDLQARATVRWLGNFTRGKTRVSPSAAVGIRHLLTDAETGVWQSVNDAAPVLVKSQSDRTAMTLTGSLTLARSRHALSLAYDGEYSPDAQRHNVWLRCSWLF
ncbi:MAG: autotransporter outer membrane beta-barrel domain-containing protein [Phycisphaerales bacterium]